MTEVEAAAAAVTSRYLRAQDALSSVRTQVLMASVSVRDALLDTEPATRAASRDRAERAIAAAERALAQYAPILDTPAEQRGIASLNAQVATFGTALRAALAADATRPAGMSARALLEQQLIPQREAVLRISQQVRGLNRSSYTARNAETTGIYRDAQRHAWQQLGFALGASLLIGIVAGVYTGRLESRVRRQRARDQQMTHELQRLSGAVVTAQEDERRMIARELHDEVGQALATIRVELALAQRTPADAATVGPKLELLRTITESTLKNIRDLSHLLHPSTLDDLGLVATIESLVSTHDGRNGLHISFSHRAMEARLPRRLESAIFRITQEGLTNVTRHAAATTCRIDLQRVGDTVRLRIEDNGRGFSTVADADAVGLAPAQPSRGLGLIGMRERAVLFGGTLSIASTPGHGTTLTLELPVTDDPEQEDRYGSPTHLSR
jgi:signal transduction histidine kinase